VRCPAARLAPVYSAHAHTHACRTLQSYTIHRRLLIPHGPASSKWALPPPSGLSRRGRPPPSSMTALGRSHGVASFSNGSVDVFQHRRAIPKHPGKTGSVVLDDTDRIFSQIWISLGQTTTSNRDRIAMKLALARPPALAFGTTPVAPTATSSATATATSGASRATPILPAGVHLQSVRASDPNISALVFRLQHLYADGEDPIYSTSMPVDPATVIKRILAPGVTPTGLPQPMTLDGTQPAAALAKRRHFPTESPSSHLDERALISAAREKLRQGRKSAVQLRPMELATYKVGLA